MGTSTNNISINCVYSKLLLEGLIAEILYVSGLIGVALVCVLYLTGILYSPNPLGQFDWLQKI